MNLGNKIATILFFFIILFLPVLPELCPLKIKTTEEEEGCPNSARSKNKRKEEEESGSGFWTTFCVK
jgi:hypothetical protein